MSKIELQRPGHFIASESCRYGRTTMLPESGVYVSSVGEYDPDGDGEFHPIGSSRTFETYVFRWTTGDRCTDPECDCGGLPRPDGWSEIEGMGSFTREECEANHAALVEKYLTLPRDGERREG